ncbi:CAP domain-containing protein [Thermus antranikianii]
MKVKRFLLGSLVLGLLPLLSACGNLLQAQKPPVEVLAPQNGYYEAQPGEEKTLTVRLAPGVEGAQVYLRLSDPCAQGKAYCPGWDTNRYPGVEHTRETFTLTASSPEVTFHFAVAQDALPQGPFKWEVVAVDGQGREWTTPVYLRILQPGDENLLQAVNRWRALVGVPLAQREDLERGFECWQYGRYRTKNLGNPDYPHTTDPNKPYWTPGADRCARTSQNSSLGLCFYPAKPLPANITAQKVDGLVSVPIHRFAWISHTSEQPTAWGGFYVEAQEWEGRSGGVCYRGGFSGHLDAMGLPRQILFPLPNTSVSYRAFLGEWPSPIEACNATQAPRTPYRNTEATWAYPAGLAITVMTSAPYQAVDTEATYARLVRLGDGAELPVCAFGSRQFWNQDPGATNTAVRYLRNYGALVVLPKDPLDPDQEYEVEVRGLFNGSEKSYRWRFRVAEGAAL